MTDLSVFQGGREIARKDIRVNDPLEVQGFVFHQNTFGPSVDLTIRDPAGQLVWTGPMLLDDTVGDFPSGFTTIPGSAVGVLARAHEDRRRDAGTAAPGRRSDRCHGRHADPFRALIGVGGTADPALTEGYAITWDSTGAWTGMVIKNDPARRSSGSRSCASSAAS